jgi:DNA mismatch endonuclease (patch repair protein)
VAVFVDGAFWHGHPSRHRPGRSGAYWDEKIAANVRRDRQADDELRALGWDVVRLWDFEVGKDLDGSVQRVMKALAGAPPARPGRAASLPVLPSA